MNCNFKKDVNQIDWIQIKKRPFSAEWSPSKRSSRRVFLGEIDFREPYLQRQDLYIPLTNSPCCSVSTITLPCSSKGGSRNTK